MNVAYRPVVSGRDHGTLLGVLELSGSPEVVSVAREYVRANLGADHPALDDVTLLVSEVVTNAVIHSDSKSGGRVTLTLSDHERFIRVDVVDAGGSSFPRVSGDEFAENGRGLVMVQVLSSRWDVREDGSGRRTVWFEVKYACNTPTGERRGQGGA